MRSSVCIAAAIFGLLLLDPALLHAQGSAASRSAAARALWREAAGALERRDSLGALSLLDSIVRTWPGQPVYVRAEARLAGRLGATERALAALDRLTLLGAGWDGDDPALAPLSADPRFRAAAARNRQATLPVERSTLLWAVGNDSLRVEGAAEDGPTGRWFISGVRRGGVLVRGSDGRVREFITADAAGAGATLGMAVDQRRGLLWVTVAGLAAVDPFPEFDGRSALLAFDLRTGAFRARVELPPAEVGHQLGDVIITPRGTLFASDSRAPMVFRIPAGPIPAVAQVAVQGHPLFRSLQGMVVTPDERVLYLADYSHGLLRVDLERGEVTELPPPPGGTLLGIDGMASAGPGRLVAVQNGIIPVRIIGIELAEDGRAVRGLEVLDRPALAPGEATLGVRSGNAFVYVATLPAALRRLPLPPP